MEDDSSDVAWSNRYLWIWKGPEPSSAVNMNINRNKYVFWNYSQYFFRIADWEILRKLCAKSSEKHSSKVGVKRVKDKPLSLNFCQQSAQSLLTSWPLSDQRFLFEKSIVFANSSCDENVSANTLHCVVFANHPSIFDNEVLSATFKNIKRAVNFVTSSSTFVDSMLI